jgi:hypothetical protein
VRQQRNYRALHETRRELDELQNVQLDNPRQPRNYEALRETQHDLDERQTQPTQPVRRSWTHYGGMEPQQASAHVWIRQNHEIRMAQNQNSGADREAQGNRSPREELNQAELQEARAAVEEARQREAAERAREQQRERSGPER